MKTFITFNLFIAFGIMKCMKALLIVMVTTNSVCTGSCSKDTELIANQPEIAINEKSKEAEKTDTEKDSYENKGESDGSTESGQGAEGQPQQEPIMKSVEKIQIFPNDHALKKSISNKPVDKNSEAILTHIDKNISTFPDFGSGTWKGEPIGIPFTVVGKNQPKIPVTFRGNATDANYGHESEKGPFPIPLNAPVEAKFAMDGHVITVDVDNGMLYELYNAEQSGAGWVASSAAVFDLNSKEMRPEGWTSADAAGLPIFPLLVRYEETQTGEIDHPIRFVLERSKIYEGYVHPANHLIAGKKRDNLLPMGGRLRLKADFDISSFSATNQVILRAMKKYGLILADVGVNMYLKGAPHEKWDNNDLRELKKVKVSNFEVIELVEIKIRD